MHPNSNTRGSDSFYYQQLQDIFLTNKTYLKNIREDEKFIDFYSTWELHSIYKPLERDMIKNKNSWNWVDNKLKGFKNDTFFKTHLELLIEANYELYVNGIFYEYSIMGNHKVNKLKSNVDYKYLVVFERILVDLENKIFGNNKIQSKVWSKYEKNVVLKSKRSVGL